LLYIGLFCLLLFCGNIGIVRLLERSLTNDFLSSSIQDSESESETSENEEYISSSSDNNNRQINSYLLSPSSNKNEMVGKIERDISSSSKSKLNQDEMKL